MIGAKIHVCHSMSNAFWLVAVFTLSCCVEGCPHQNNEDLSYATEFRTDLALCRGLLYHLEIRKIGPLISSTSVSDFPRLEPIRLDSLAKQTGDILSKPDVKLVLMNLQCCMVNVQDKAAVEDEQLPLPERRRPKAASMMRSSLTLWRIT